VTDEELDRARNMLKCNVLTQLESRLVLFEDLGRQVLTYGVREDMHTTCEKIDAVSKEDLTKLALQSLSQPPTLASVGHDLSHMPQQEEVAQWFR
jgi:processing peptidase subunit alpha